MKNLGSGRSRLLPAWAVSIVVLLVFPISVSCFSGARVSSEAPRISKEDLRAVLNDHDTIVIDVRREEDWLKSDTKIPGAFHEDPLGDEERWAGKYPRGRHLVLYCA